MSTNSTGNLAARRKNWTGGDLDAKGADEEIRSIRRSLRQNFLVPGRTDGTLVPAGFIGEVIESGVITPTNSSGSTNWDNIQSIVLLAGEWDATGNVRFIANTGTGITRLIAAISVNSGGTTTDQVASVNQIESSIPDTNGDRYATIANYRLTLTAQTIVWLKSRISFGGGNPQYGGFLRAVRRG